MIQLLFGLLGGIGMFLLGMTLLKEGMESYAGDSLRQRLLRLTDRPVKAFAAGAIVTALVQSSTATTVTVIGFVSAGLLSFTHAVGVVFGASLGTTATGWIVSVLGLKVSIGFYAMPLIGVGAFMRLLARGRWRALGLALAGFGVLFVGIETLQRSMEGLSGVFRLSALPSAGLGAHVLAMLTGMLLTLILQSSSAAAATTLTALHTGSINFEQAASLVIGAAVGTTVTGALAAIGGSVPAKRTALAHILFNLATGVIAILLLPVLLQGIAWAQAHAGLDAGPVSLAAFHSLFIGLGVLIFLPVTGRFARAIERILPERDDSAVRNLHASLLQAPAAALENVRDALANLAREMVGIIREHIVRPAAAPPDPRRAARVVDDLRKAHDFFSGIPPVAGDAPLSDLRVNLLHATDHLHRMEKYLRPKESVRRMFGHDRAAAIMARGLRVLDAVLLGIEAAGVASEEEAGWAGVGRLAAEAIAFCDSEREALIREAAASRIDAPRAMRALEAAQWVARLCNHLDRIVRHLFPAP